MNYLDKHTFAVCAYGKSPYLDECLHSLKQQTAKSEILIATSTPSSFIDELAHKYNVPVFVNSGPGGIANDWNFAISCVKSKYATIAHQDDIYEPSYAESAVTQMNLNNRPLIYFCDYGEIRDDEYLTDSPLLQTKRKLLSPLKQKGRQDSKFFKRSIISLGNSICCPSVTYNLDLLSQPLFNTGMRSNLDWEVWESLSKMEGSFVYDPTVRMFHRVHEDSETSACIVDDVRTKEDQQMLAKFWPSPVATVINSVYIKAQRYN